MRKPRLGLALLLFGAAPVAAEDDLARDAERVLAAAKLEDTAALAALALAEQPGGWVLAHELCARGEFEAAAKLARAATGKDFEALPAYVESRRGKADDAETRKVLRAAQEHFDGGDAAACLAAIGERPWQGRSAIEVRLRVIQGYALASAGREEEAADSMRAAATEAADLGDLRSAAEANQVGAGILFRLGQYFACRDTCVAWAAVERQRGDAPGEAESLESLASAGKAIQDRALLLPTYERLATVQEAAGNRGGAAWAVARLGALQSETGDTAGGLRSADRALEMAEAVGDPGLLMNVLMSCGTIRLTLGGDAREKGRAYLLRALDLSERAVDARSRSTVQLAVAQAFMSAGEYDDAIPHLEKAREAFEKMRHPVVAMVLNYLGDAYDHKKERGRALEYHRKALEIANATGDRRFIAMCTVGLGNSLLSFEEYGEALPVAQKSVELARELVDQDLLLNALWAHAHCLFRLGKAEEALGELEPAVEILRRIFSGLGDEEGAEARSRMAAIFSLGVAAASRIGDAAQVFSFMEGGRGAALLESLGGRAQLRENAIPEKLRNEERDARLVLLRAQGLHEEAVKSRNFAMSRARKQELDAARAAVEEAVQRIQREQKSASGVLYPRPLALPAAQAMLAEGDVLLLYSVLPEDAMALVVAPGSARIVPLGKREPIAQACAALHLDDRDEDPAAGIAALGKLLVEPLGLGQDVRRILVTPEGVLSPIPFGVMAGGREVVYVPSATTYALLREWRDLRGQKILALGDAQYGGRLAQLPHTRIEAEAIGDTTLLGEDATVADLTSALSGHGRWRAVHLACHGLIDLEQPTLSSLALTGGNLTAYEVMRLDFASDLVVLSACETGRGKVVSGEGLMGLTRAFMLAGAPRVVVSLWPVEDEATLALMRKLYEGWKGGLPVSTALVRAQEHVRSQEKWRHPLYWAAWQLWGLPD